MAKKKKKEIEGIVVETDHDQKEDAKAEAIPQKAEVSDYEKHPKFHKFKRGNQ